MILIIIQIILIIILFGLIIFLSEHFFNILLRGFAPFIATRSGIIDKIVNELKLSREDVVYELGCGKAGFLRVMRRHYPKNKLVGIEYLYTPYFISRIQNSFLKNKLIIKRENIFKADIGKADFIYCYLNILAMKKLSPKFARECKPGCLVISFQFLIPEKDAQKILKVSKNEKVYFYKY
ncbi:hypothetical protein DRH27_00665 [Candidatus Falkowbacteria bacterium]|nr:MAG: hypothetical protein DRH27_00665 [Candidatus Falkowbacteria bacterium]